MKFKVSREKLLKALQRVISTIGNRSTLPILGNVLIEAEGAQLKLTTTDLEIRISTEVEAEIAEAGRTTVPAKKFLALVSRFGEDDLSFENDERHHASLVCGNSRCKLLGLPADEFPAEMQFTPVRRLIYKESDLRRIFSQITYAVSLDDSRKVLHGVLCSCKDNSVAFVATDGKRLAVVEKLPEEFAGTEGEVIIPLRAANEIKRLADGEEKVTLEIGDKQAAFITDTVVVSTKLIEGNYPNYRQVIPARFASQVNVPAQALLNKIELVSQLLSDNNSFIVLTFENNQLRLQAASAEIGEGTAIVEIEYSGEPIEVSFNPAFLAEPLRAATAESVTVNLNDGISPVAMDGSDGFLYVIMPMRNR
ncbi:MAG: DNA polymerase III subunit beta [Victivallaceae bacterium]|nr:DNA polymerase III subunit beta [Victivallaceae bacterium]